MKPHSRGSSRGPSQRQLRVGERIRHILAEVLARGELHDDALRGQVITVSEVQVSPDLRNATVFVAPLGGGDVTAVLAGLARCKKFLRGALGKGLTTKYTPELTFSADGSFDEASRMEALLSSERVRADVARGTPEDGDAPQSNTDENGTH